MKNENVDVETLRPDLIHGTVDEACYGAIAPAHFDPTSFLAGLDHLAGYPTPQTSQSTSARWNSHNEDNADKWASSWLDRLPRRHTGAGVALEWASFSGNFSRSLLLR